MSWKNICEDTRVVSEILGSLYKEQQDLHRAISQHIYQYCRQDYHINSRPIYCVKHFSFDT